MPTPLVLDGRLYVLRDNGTLLSFDAATGEQRYRTRLGRGGSGYTASAVAGGGKVYLTGEMCDTCVVEPGSEFRLLQTNSLDAICMATPAIADGHLYFRTDGHLIAIATRGMHSLRCLPLSISPPGRSLSIASARDPILMLQSS
jgi:hypothetical protein